MEDGVLSNSRTVLFIHIRKAAGTSVTGHLQRKFPREHSLVGAHDHLDSPGDWSQYDLVEGHVDFSCLNRFSRLPAVATFLRDPVDRSISTYYWFKQRGDAPQLHTLGDRQRQLANVIEACQSFELPEFLEKCPELVEMFLRNHQTRVLAGHDPLINPTSVADIDLLDRAKANLIRCHSVGLVERFGESLDVMSDALGLGPLGAPMSMNVSHSRPRREALSSGVLAELERITALDAELYRAAQARFERDLLSRAEHRTQIETCTAIPGDTFEFDRTFLGDGWYAPERTAEGWVCWLGPEREAWLEFLRPTTDVGLVRLDVAHAVSKEILNSVEVRANGLPLTLNFGEARSGCTIDARWPEAAPLASAERLRISISVCRTEVPQGGDSRSLGIALSRIQLLQVS